MHFNILTLFPDFFPGALGASVTGRALKRKQWSFKTIDIRDFAIDNYRSVDDTPFGGGPGMVMRADILEAAFLSLENPGRRIYLSPRGKPLSQPLVKEMSLMPDITLLCGRYEGVDQRFLDAYEFEEISIGDFVLAGGEIPAMGLMESCIRLLPGVLGNALTPDEESFSENLLEYPHYTKPAKWTTKNGQKLNVPDILRSGDHGKIARWRKNAALETTRQRRPELLKSGYDEKKR